MWTIFDLLLTVEVPGCDPYREYLFNYLRDQPIWSTLRFWNAALFYALQKDKVPKANVAKSSSSAQLKTEAEATDALINKKASPKQPSRSISESSLSSSSSSTDNTKSSGGGSKQKANWKKSNRSRSSTAASGGIGGGGDDNTFDVDEKKLQDNMAFSHLG